MNETHDGTKSTKVEQTSLELLELVMYGNEATGEKDQAYEDLKKQLIIANEELKQVYDSEKVLIKDNHNKQIKLDKIKNCVTNEYFFTTNVDDSVVKVPKLLQILEDEGGKQ